LYKRISYCPRTDGDQTICFSYLINSDASDLILNDNAWIGVMREQKI
jgi:hypothetical protein